MVVGTGIGAGAAASQDGAASTTTASSAAAGATEESKVDPAVLMAREREELKVPEEERKMMGQVSDIEKKILAKQDKEAKAKKEEAEKDYSWWRFDDPQTYFCVSTKDQYAFKAG